MSEFFIPKPVKKETWYKEPWMWLVIGGPLVVVIAGFITLYLAMHGADKVVSKDYYKQGVNINKTIEQDAKAAQYRLTGEMKIDQESNKFLLSLKGDTPLPRTVQLSVSSSSSTSEFESLQQVTLYQVKNGMYEGPINTKTPSNSQLWHIRIEADDWRLAADWHHPLQQKLQLMPQQ